MIQHLASNLRRHVTVNDGETLLLAVSGGADSLALLHGMVALRDEGWPLSLVVASFDHNTREGSAQDVALVQSFCDEWNVLCAVGKAKRVMASESALREARYRFLAKTAQEIGAEKVMTAHHADDQAETVLLRLLRGTGLRGLSGMAWTAPLPYATTPNQRVIRPLLNIRKQEILDYCREHGLSFRDDPTNHQRQYRRNRIRHEIIPSLEAINPQVVDALTRLAANLAADENFMESAFHDNILPQIEKTDSAWLIPLETFRGWHPAMQARAIRDAAEAQGGTVDYRHVQAVIAQAQEALPVGAVIEFDGDAALYRDYRQLIIGRLDAYFAGYAMPFSLKPAAEITLRLPERGERIEYRFDEGWTLVIQGDGIVEEDAKAHGRFMLPAGARLQLRTRRAGDRFAPGGMKGKTQKLKQWMMDRKIPRPLRDRIPLLVVDERVAMILYSSDWAVSEFVRQQQGDNSEDVKPLAFFGKYSEE